VDAVASATDARISELEQRDKHDAWLGLGLTLAPGQRLDLEHREGTEDRQADARERSGRRRYHITYNDIQRWLDSVAWDANWSQQLQTQLRAYGSTIDVVNRRTEGVTTNLPQRIDERVLEGQATWTHDAHAAVGGFEARNEALRDPGLSGARSLLRHRSLYAQDQWHLAEPLTLTLGLRHDDHDRYGREWSPRAYAVWRAGGPWTIKGGYSHGFKVPNLKQVVPGARQEGPNTFLGNPDLEPERSDALEFGVGYDAAPLQAQAMLFDQRVKNLIEVLLVSPGAAPGLGTYTYQNLSKARLRGLEASAARPLGAGFALGLTYTYLDATSGSGQRLERRPRHSAGVRLDWTHGPWRLGLGVEHAADQLLPAATANTPSQPVPDLTLWSAHASCTPVEGLEVGFGVTNLTNVSLAQESPLFTQAEAPRTWRATMRWRW
jgi:outer membrane receptor for ferrienterochelin and colicins